MFDDKNEPMPQAPRKPVRDKLSTDTLRMMRELGQDLIAERRTRRRWGLFFKFLLAGYVGVALLLYALSPDEWFDEDAQHTALVDINGLIGADAESADKINQSLRHAFAAANAEGVVLRINSPGGSPVQAAEINAEIRRLRMEYPHKPFYAVAADICASGGYYVAVAADEIYANPASLVGSIGVRLDGFGFVDSMKKLGIERRLLTAGDNKAMLDPFTPEVPAQVAHAQSVLQAVHRQFIDAVKLGRGNRLVDYGHGDGGGGGEVDAENDVFSGLFWSGEQARKLGLVDEFGSVDDVARDVIGAPTVVDYTLDLTWLDRFSEQLGGVVARLLLAQHPTLK